MNSINSQKKPKKIVYAPPPTDSEIFIKKYTIIMVTHNMQQASRISDLTGFFNVETNNQGDKTGYLVEYAATQTIFENPQEQATQD